MGENGRNILPRCLADEIFRMRAGPPQPTEVNIVVPGPRLKAVLSRVLNPVVPGDTPSCSCTLA